MRRQRGLTLVEVLVALVMLAAGVLVAVLFQVTSIRANTASDVGQRLSRLVATELEYWRQTTVASGTYPCVTELPGGFDPDQCGVTVAACSVVYATPVRLECPGPVGVFRIDVTATSPLGDTMQVTGISTGLFVSGSLGEGGE